MSTGRASLDEPQRIGERAPIARAVVMTLATKDYSVAENQNTQVGGVFRDMGITGSIDVAGLEVMVTAGRALVYASLTDNRTGDGTFIEAIRGE
jgi:hypothetical protein